MRVVFYCELSFLASSRITFAVKTLDIHRESDSHRETLYRYILYNLFSEFHLKNVLYFLRKTVQYIGKTQFFFPRSTAFHR